MNAQPITTDPTYGQPPAVKAQWQRLADVAAQGRKEEREVAAWELARMTMERTLP